MLFYIVLFLYCIFVLVINNKVKQSQKRFFEIGTLMILCIVSGTRYYLGGSDYYLYELVFDGLPNFKQFIVEYSYIHEKYVTFGFEKGYLFYNSIIKTLGFNFFGFTLINSIIFYSCLYIGFKRYSYNFNLLIIVFLYKIFFYNTFISMRQSVTVAIFFISMHYIEEKKPFKYFAWIYVATLFHSASFILAPIYFINRFNLSRKRLIMANIIFLPTILFSIFKIPVMKIFYLIVNFSNNAVVTQKAESLIIGTSGSSIGMFHTLEYFIIMILVISNFKKIIKVNSHSEFILKIFLILLPILTLFRGYEILTRVKDYFTLTYAIILGYLCIIDNKRSQRLVQIATIIICGYGFFRFIVLFDQGAMAPYESYIFKGMGIVR